MQSCTLLHQESWRHLSNSVEKFWMKIYCGKNVSLRAATILNPFILVKYDIKECLGRVHIVIPCDNIAIWKTNKGRTYRFLTFFRPYNRPRYGGRVKTAPGAQRHRAYDNIHRRRCMKFNFNYTKTSLTHENRENGICGLLHRLKNLIFHDDGWITLSFVVSN